MKMEELAIGTRIYNRGDVANMEHFGAITGHNLSKWGDQVQITPEDADIKSYWVPLCMIHNVDSGNGTTRIVTAEAHKAYRAERIKAWEKTVEEMRALEGRPS